MLLHYANSPKCPSPKSYHSEWNPIPTPSTSATGFTHLAIIVSNIRPEFIYARWPFAVFNKYQPTFWHSNFHCRINIWANASFEILVILCYYTKAVTDKENNTLLMGDKRKISFVRAEISSNFAFVFPSPTPSCFFFSFSNLIFFSIMKSVIKF